MSEVELSEDVAGLLSNRLRILTEKISRIAPDALYSGLLGGEFGYGCRFSNSTFTMRPYYWGDCTCGINGDLDCKPTCETELPNFKYGDFEVRWYKYIGRGMEVNRGATPAEIDAMMDACEDSLWDELGASRKETFAMVDRGELQGTMLEEQFKSIRFLIQRSGPELGG